MSIRERLRKLIGWDEVDTRLKASEASLTIAVSRLDEQSKRIDLIDYKRDHAPAKPSVLDWEAQQQEFLNNPDNFKEEKVS